MFHYSPTCWSICLPIYFCLLACFLSLHACWHTCLLICPHSLFVDSPLSSAYGFCLLMSLFILLLDSSLALSLAYVYVYRVFIRSLVGLPVCLFVHFYLFTYQNTCLFICSCLHTPSILFACTLASMAVEFSFTHCCYMVPVCLLESLLASIGPHAALLACSFVVTCWLAPLLSCAYVLAYMLVELSVYYFARLFVFCLLVLAFICSHAGLFAYQFFGLCEYCPRGSVDHV